MSILIERCGQGGYHGREHVDGLKPRRMSYENGKLDDDGRKRVVTRKQWACDGCGRVLPKGSRVLQWQVWRQVPKTKGKVSTHTFNVKTRLRFCSDCESVIYGCDGRESIRFESDDMLVRRLCERCDEYPFCDKVTYMRKDLPGKVFFGDLPM